MGRTGALLCCFLRRWGRRRARWRRSRESAGWLRSVVTVMQHTSAVRAVVIIVRHTSAMRAVEADTAGWRAVRTT